LVDGPVTSRTMSGSGILARVTVASTIAVAAVLAVARPAARAQGSLTIQACDSTPSLTVSIISPADGGAAPGQTIEAGVFSITNTSCVVVSVDTVTVSFSKPSLFSSATLSPPAAGPTPSNVPPPGAHFVRGIPLPGPVTLSPPPSSTTFTFSSPFPIEPGAAPFFGLTVKLSPLSRNDTSGVAYAGVMDPTAASTGMPLWVAFAMLGLAMAALPEGTRRRLWLLAALIILFATGAPGCGSDSGGPGLSSTQTVTAVSAVPSIAGVVVRTIGTATVTGLPLKLGTITGH
jgi:hypothetical protein